MKILPVIHHVNGATSLEQAALAFDAEADGVFLISHLGDDDDIVVAAKAIKSLHPNKLVGLNMLSKGPVAAFKAACREKLDMAWGDACGVDSYGLNDLGRQLADLAKASPSVKLFASVAFKYQPIEPDPALAALNAFQAGFIPTTSGEATGSAPSPEKIIAMSKSGSDTLAIASGMDVNNVASFAKHLSHILVATGVSINDRFDYELLCRFVAIAKKNRK